MMRSLARESKILMICERIELTFLILCASSMTMYSHESFFSVDFSR